MKIKPFIEWNILDIINLSFGISLAAAVIFTAIKILRS